MFLPHPRVKVSIVGSLRDREVACSASDRQGSNFESCVWRTVSSQSSHHPQEVLLAQFSLYVHKGGLKPDSFHLVHNILGFHALTGSDSSSQFYGHGKKTSWSTFLKYPKLLDRLGRIHPTDMSDIELFVIKMYSQKSTTTSIDNLQV